MEILAEIGCLLVGAMTRCDRGQAIYAQTRLLKRIVFNLVFAYFWKYQDACMTTKLNDITESPALPFPIKFCHVFL